MTAPEVTDADREKARDRSAEPARSTEARRAKRLANLARELKGERIRAARRREHRRQYSKAYREKMLAANPDWDHERYAAKYRNGSDKVLASVSVRHAVSVGTIIRPEFCERCGAPCQPDGHHEDYSKRLRVRWLCRECHGAQHRIRAGEAK